MEKQLINTIKNIEPEYSNNNNFLYPLPEAINLHLDNEDYLIEITLNNKLLETNVYVGEDKYNLTDKDIDFIYNYLTDLLNHQIDLTKRYYEEESYHKREVYNEFGSFYIK